MFKFFLIALLATSPLLSGDYILETNACDENADMCMPPEEDSQNPPVAYREGRRCKWRCRSNCCWNRDQDASWPGKIDDPFRDSLTR